ncbi:TonB family protein [Lentibacter algarum]|uniref:cell envelope integrity protein TolA n=1 Tax=Lentibacter algarum TaxID=576131 RepID=UPI001C0992AD|nr:energy transducer TonB [Lentibacter algarum]MBU2982639.1 TonB family protein [Lentibacter algarum]
MRALLEIISFGAIALAAHLAIWPAPDETSLESAGSAGNELLTISASTASVAQMVEAWDKPPEVAQIAEPDVAPPETPEVQQAAMPQPQASQPPRAMPTIKLPELSPSADAPALPTYEKPKPRPKPTPKPTPKPVQKATPKPRPKPAVQPKPKPAAQPKAKPAAQPKKAHKPAVQSTARKAQGTGGNTVKGNNRKARTATLSKSKRNSLLGKWGGQIRARVARRSPRGVGRGKAVVRITVSADGSLISARLAKSSGNNKIDKLALHAVKRAGRFPAAPKQLGISKHTFNLPIVSK